MREDTAPIWNRNIALPSAQHWIAMHELFHALGFSGHLDDDGSVLYPVIKGTEGRSDGTPQAWSSNEDEAALGTVYSWGPDWNSNTALMGETRNGTVFGVSGDTIQFPPVHQIAPVHVPWVYGTPVSGTFPEFGTGQWNGFIVGFADDRKRVAGQAALTVDFATTFTSQHNLGFYNMRVWDNVKPSITGDALWNGDGSLDYKVSVNGVRFQRAGGDGGTINGRFFGNAGRDMGGTLHRRDLTAAFGGSR